MMSSSLVPLCDRLLKDWQRDFPLVPRPFEAIAALLATSEHEVIETLESLRTEGKITRVGGVVRPNTLGASTLAAMPVPDFQVGSAATVLCSIPGVNHIYLRENDLNLWFVVTGPDREYVDHALTQIRETTGCPVLDLRLERSYHIDLGFKLSGDDGGKVPAGKRAGITRPSDYSPRPVDRPLAQALSEGLPLVPKPFASIGAKLGCSEGQVIERLQVLVGAGVVPRIGVIVRHRALGWRSNAMVVWDIPAAEADSKGELLACAPGINLCYRRTRYEKDWPYNLYCMIHARSREEALGSLRAAEGLANLQGFRREVLFSVRCFKQSGAMLSLPQEAA